MSDLPVRLDGMVPDQLQPRTARILLDSLAVDVVIGFHDFEVGSPQRLLVTIEIWLDEVPRVDHDDPALAWDYDYLRKLVQELAASGRYNLQETLAGAIYQRVASMKGVKALRVATAKPDIYPDANGVGIELASF